MQQANAVDPTHDAMDSMADWAAEHPITKRTPRPFIPQGCTQQDRLVPTIPPKAASDAEQAPKLSASDSDPTDDFTDIDEVFWAYVAPGLVGFVAICSGLYRIFS
jgi:hypothetical protein